MLRNFVDLYTKEQGMKYHGSLPLQATTDLSFLRDAIRRAEGLLRDYEYQKEQEQQQEDQGVL
jgi:hypothetical protein